MGGATIELAAIGLNDNELIGNPQVTFFKSVSKRHTNFSVESREIRTVSDTINFGSSDIEFDIEKVHDLLTNVYAEVVVSGSGTANEYTVNHFANSLIKEVKLNIGGKEIETLYSQWLQIYHELANDSNKFMPDYYHTSQSDSTGGGENQTFNFTSDNTSVRTPIYYPNRIYGDTPLVFGANNYDGADTAGSTTYYKKFYIPIPFFFTKNSGAALPLCALTAEEIKIRMTLETSANLKGSVTTITLESFKLYGDFVLLERDERNRFTTSNLSYLVETVQRLEFTTPSSLSGSNSKELTEKKYSLNGIKLSVKYICWVVVNTGTGKGQGPCNFASLCDNNENGDDGYYGKASILLNNEPKQKSRCMSYFTRFLPQKYCKRQIPHSDRIGVYSFGLSPFDYQPSGTCNFNRLNHIDVQITLANNNRSLITSKPIHFYAVNYNILNISGGISGLKYN